LGGFLPALGHHDDLFQLPPGMGPRGIVPGIRGNACDYFP
jgi:hypothetical protein